LDICSSTATLVIVSEPSLRVSGEPPGLTAPE
jgi:hypothetical protein